MVLAYKAVNVTAPAYLQALAIDHTSQLDVQLYDLKLDVWHRHR